MKNGIKASVFKWYLRVVVIIQCALWGITHIFFPDWYMEFIAGSDPKLLSPAHLLALNEIGVSIVAVSIATWIASSRPVKYFPVILINYLIGLGSAGVTLYHILVRRASQEWPHIYTVLIMLTILTVLYPWKELRQELSSKM